MSVLHNKVLWSLSSCPWLGWAGLAGLYWAVLGWRGRAAIPDNEGKNRAQAQAEDNG